MAIRAPDGANNANEVPKWVYDKWVLELLIPNKMIRMFGPKTAILREGVN